MNRTYVIFTLALLCAGCSPSEPIEAVLVGVMVDNHQNAREYQRGLHEALLVQEHLVEGGITRFEAVYNLAEPPEYVSPIRSVRPYFIDGMSPHISAIYHAGGSPEALEKFLESGSIVSFNALNMGNEFGYDEDARQPHHRFLTDEKMLSMAAEMTNQKHVLLPLFPIGKNSSNHSAPVIDFDFRGPVHNITYVYDEVEGVYARINRDELQASQPTNILVLETDVAVTGELGRLSVRTTGSGAGLLFRDGTVQKGRWHKTDSTFYSFMNETGEPIFFTEGQVWMIIIDSLEDRVSY